MDPDKLMQKWRKGGMTSNRLRDSANVRNYFYTPGRQNLIPDPTQKANIPGSIVSSIGKYTTRGTKQIASSTYGPGTLLSSNVQSLYKSSPNEMNMGKQIQNSKRTQYVDYRTTAPFLVDNLRNNPLSIYAVGDAKDKPVPAFFAYVRPENYDTYQSVPDDNISFETKYAKVMGSPQINILGLDKPNPFLGLKNIPGTAEFNGKAYGGNNNSSAKYIAEHLYNQAWKDNYEDPVQVMDKNGQQKIETFSDHRLGACKNDALVHFAPGYNISNQIIDNKMSTWVGKGKHAVDNLPWGPKKLTGNPLTQKAGLWFRGNNPWPTKNTGYGYKTNINVETKPDVSTKYEMCLPNGTLICS